jgi:HlyD family secretion protein
MAPISESVYASGVIKSRNQYQAFATVNGIIEKLFVSEGDTVKAGMPLLSIANETQKWMKENAELAAQLSDIRYNQDQLNEARQAIGLSKTQMMHDSVLLCRQQALWRQQIGTKVELEQRELAYQNSRTAFYSALVRYNTLERQLHFTSEQSKRNLLISRRQESDFTLKSEMDGVVYNLFKTQGEIVSPQTPLAIIGDARHFYLEMQVDENDILKVKKGLPVLVTMDSYKGKVFDAQVAKVYPYMNERSKTFLVEAEFTRQPATLYPNVTFEANIVLQTKDKALLIPRNYLLNDSIALKSNGDQVVVKTGLKDYRQVEIISGLSAEDELLKPKE